MRALRRAALAAACSAAVAGAGVGPALGAAVARSTGGAPVTSATWAAAAGPEGGPAVRGEYVVRFQPGTPIPPTYFDVINTGSLDLTGQTYRAFNIKPTSGNAPPTVTLDACIGARFEKITNTCPSLRQMTLTTTDQGATPVTLALPVGAFVNVRAQPSRLANFPQEFSTVVNVTVARTQASPGRTRTS